MNSNQKTLRDDHAPGIDDQLQAIGAIAQEMFSQWPERNAIAPSIGNVKSERTGEFWTTAHPRLIKPWVIFSRPYRGCQPAEHL